MYSLKIAMISTHPESGGGVSSYTQNLIQSLRKNGLEVNLFSNKVSNTFKNKNGIIPCWDFGIFYPFQIFSELSRYNPDVIHIQHEYFLYGRMFSTAVFPLLLLFTKLLRGKVIITIHGIIPLSEIDEKFMAINEIQGPALPFKIGLLFLTKIIVKLTDVVIAHGNFFAETLRREYSCPRDKIHVIPHGVKEVKDKISQDIAKKKLGLENKTVILFFGYIAKYKGIETLIDGFQLLAKKYPEWILIIGGGEHPRLKTHQAYKTYISKLYDKSLTTSNQIIFTGFIKEEDISTYFFSADLIALPYNLIMSSSGPFALAASYEKTVIASNIPPFNNLLPPQALFKKDNPQNLSEKFKIILTHHNMRIEIDRKIAEISRQNSWNEVGLKTNKIYQHITKA